MADDEPTPAEIAARIALDEAEAVKFLAEAESSLADGRKADAETAVLNERLREAAVAARGAEILLDREEHKRRIELAADSFHHTYLFDKSVDAASVKAAVNQLAQWERTSSEPLKVEIVINSPGGSIIDGFALIDYIDTLHSRGHTVNTTAYGMAASMGGVLLQTGKTRAIGRNAILLLHEGSLGVGGDFGKVEDMVSLMKLLHERILDLFVSRAQPLNAKTTKAFIKGRWERKDWWLSAEDAVRLGFADRLADAPEPTG